MVSWHQLSGSLLLYLAGTALVQAQSGTPVPSVGAIIGRLAQARGENRARLRPYKVTRTYKLFTKEGGTPKSEVMADVTFVPPDSKQYVIQHTSGIGLGEKIVRQMLKHEMDVMKNYSSAEISQANYDFRFSREELVAGQNCYVLEMRPKREEKNLLVGYIWVDSTTYRLRRTEGQPAKIPSWWLRDVHIELLYGEVGGMWLQTASESSADVRLLGPYTIFSRDLDYEFNEPGAVANLTSTPPLGGIRDLWPLAQHTQ